MIKIRRLIRSQSEQSFPVSSIRTDTAISPRPEIEHESCIIKLRNNQHHSSHHRPSGGDEARKIEKVVEPTPDQTEDFKVALIPLFNIPELIRKGEIDNAMVINAFYWVFLLSQERLAIP